MKKFYQQATVFANGEANPYGIVINTANLYPNCQSKFAVFAFGDEDEAVTAVEILEYLADRKGRYHRNPELQTDYTICFTDADGDHEFHFGTTERMTTAMEMINFVVGCLCRVEADMFINGSSDGGKATFLAYATSALSATTDADHDDDETKREQWTITRQDGKTITVALDEDGELVCDLRHIGEAWLLVVTDDDSDEEVVVGVYFDRDDADDAMEAAETTGLIPFQKISAAEYLRVTDKDYSPKNARELKGITALEYLNDETDD